MPRLRLLPPGLGSLVMQTPRPHRHARLHIPPWLERIAVKHEPVDPLAERPITQRLDTAWMPLPFLPVRRRERLSPQDGFAVDVRCRCHLRAPVGAAAKGPRPELAHWLIGLPRVSHIVAAAIICFD